MLLTIEINNRPVQINLNWGTKTWSLANDPANFWKTNISRFGGGDFKRKEWGVIWLRDAAFQSKEPLVIIWDGPNHAQDASKKRGKARINSSSSEKLKNSRCPWRITIPVERPISALRKHVVMKLEEAFKKQPIQFNDDTYQWLIGPVPNATTGTNCYVLGSGIAKQVAEFKGRGTNPNELTAYVKRMTLGATTGLPDRAKNGSWTDATGKNLPPRPGDFFALLKENTENNDINRSIHDNITHVGAILKIETPTQWRTADFGQAGKPGVGKIRTRTYDPKTNMLTSPESVYGPRLLSGWVDLDKHFG